MDFLPLDSFLWNVSKKCHYNENVFAMNQGKRVYISLSDYLWKRFWVYGFDLEEMRKIATSGTAGEYKMETWKFSIIKSRKCIFYILSERPLVAVI